MAAGRINPTMLRWALARAAQSPASIATAMKKDPAVVESWSVVLPGRSPGHLLHRRVASRSACRMIGAMILYTDVGLRIPV